MEKFFETNYIKIEWDNVNNLVYSNWLKNPSLEEYKIGLNKAIELITKKNAKFWLADTINLGIVPKESQAWILEFWTPLYKKSPICKTAMIIPKLVLAKMSIDMMLTKSKNEAENKYFDNDADAIKWLKS